MGVVVVAPDMRVVLLEGQDLSRVVAFIKMLHLDETVLHLLACDAQGNTQGLLDVDVLQEWLHP